MASEFDALQQNETWSLVPYCQLMNVIGYKWVCRIKYRADGSIEMYKVCLVAKGFHQQARVDFTKTFSTIAKPTTIRVV